MLKSVLASLFLFCIIPTQAQSGQTTEEGLINWPGNAGDTSLVFTDTAFIRSEPGLRQKPVDTLQFGDEVRVEEVLSVSSVIKGIKAPWVRISYKHNGTTRQGFCWRGLLSAITLQKTGVRLIIGYDRVVDSIVDKMKQQLYLVKLKTIVGGHKGPSIQWSMGKNDGGVEPIGKIMGNMGLTNVQHIASISFGLAACGVPDTYYYFALLKDGRLVSLPERVEMSEAGQYYNESKFIFPAEPKGRPDQITLITEHGEVPENWPDDKDPVYKVTKERKTWRWDAVAGACTAITPR